ncbi:DUF2058 family protein [Vulgatibacter sp.]|uniref:DUF2058 family protein n=1 Tax=Vulgatibacter sp. TaxID=1971226 RepID=UPI00356852AD
MGLQSLRDKLLQAGLVTEDQAKKAEADLEARKRASRDRQQQGGAPRGGGGRPQGRGPGGPNRGGGRPQQPPRELTEEEKRKREEEAAFREKERLLAKEREENRKRALEDRKKLEGLRELCEKHEVTERGDEAFFFSSRKKKVMKIFLTPEQLKALEAGQLAIMDKPMPGELATALVTREAAEGAVKIDSRALRFYNRGGGETYGFKADSLQAGPDAENTTESHEEPAVEGEAPQAAAAPEASTADAAQPEETEEKAS